MKSLRTDRTLNSSRISRTSRTLGIESLESRCLLAGGMFPLPPAAMPPAAASPADAMPAATAAQQLRPHVDQRSGHRAGEPGAERAEHLRGGDHKAHNVRDAHAHRGSPIRHKPAAGHLVPQRRGPASAASPSPPMPEPPMSRPPLPTTPLPTTSPSANSPTSPTRTDASPQDAPLAGTPRTDRGVFTLTLPGDPRSDSGISSAPPATSPSSAPPIPSPGAESSGVGGTFAAEQEAASAAGTEAALARSQDALDAMANAPDYRDDDPANPLMDTLPWRRRDPLPTPSPDPLPEWELDADTMSRLKKTVAEPQTEPSEQDTVAWDAIVASWFDGPGGLIELDGKRTPLLNAAALDHIVAVELNANVGRHRSLGRLATAEVVPSEDERRAAILNAIAEAKRPFVAPPDDEAAVRISTLTYPAVALIAGSLAAVHRRQRAPQRTATPQANNSSAPK